jgi:predicted nucleotide-binding protein (sugar kinase/HSP70/actin superfamily)
MFDIENYTEFKSLVKEIIRENLTVEIVYGYDNTKVRLHLGGEIISEDYLPDLPTGG